MKKILLMFTFTIVSLLTVAQKYELSSPNGKLNKGWDCCKPYQRRQFGYFNAKHFNGNRK
ncbi:MAG: hypothetical protein FD181_154 [Prolixibacteraceae bacterium]|nr:MAG: hypothetical protein FD181_154 [Prolixibacteraceae bacterium]